MYRSKKNDFFETELGKDVLRRLRAMAEDVNYNTTSSYSSRTDIYPDNLIPFVDRHVNYISAHPATDPEQYLANLRILTRVR